ncbi:lipoprotein, partial [Vibrio parahaemolyticus]
HTEQNSYVVEFDLRKVLEDPVGQDQKNMNSKAERLVNASDSGHIAGTVSTVQYQACEADSAAWNAIHDVPAVPSVYLYAGSMDRSTMGDMGATAPLNAPDAVANVSESQDEEGNTIYSSEYGYIGPGTYS